MDGWMTHHTIHDDTEEVMTTLMFRWMVGVGVDGEMRAVVSQRRRLQRQEGVWGAWRTGGKLRWRETTG